MIDNIFIFILFLCALVPILIFLRKYVSLLYNKVLLDNKSNISKPKLLKLRLLTLTSELGMAIKAGSPILEQSGLLTNLRGRYLQFADQLEKILAELD